MTPEQISTAYFASMVQQDLPALLALFTEDGVIVWPNGRSIAGHPAIEAAYTQLFTMPTNNPSPGPLLIAAPDYFATEVASKLPDGSARKTLNVFRTGANGLIARMDSYRQD